MKLHQVKLANGKVAYGYISRIDVTKQKFYLLRQDQPGMIGKDGDEYRFDECESVFVESDRIPGHFEGPNQISEWIRWYRQSGAR